MRNNGFFVFATCCLLVFSATSCQKIKGIFGKKKSSTTGWTYNDSKNGGIEYNNVKAQKTGPGLVFIPGGTFVMGRTQEDVMGDWNNTPKRVSIASFYMDETEVRNIDWLEYLTWLRRVYTTYPEVYQKALPDTLVWRDQLGYNEPMVKNYLRFPAYAEYPVVGVSWEQATDYCVWRTNLYKESLSLPPGQLVEPFRLPSEGEWEYAARTGKNENKFPWSTDELQDSKGCFLGNFKPGKGNYTEDGHLITSRVGSFAPNEFGLYDMAGNVAEWTSTSYSESGPSQMSDMNPDLRYNAAKNDPYAMKKKVVRGGSWKDVSQFIRSDMRTFEFQNESRSYIGFRCARTQIGFSRSKGKK